MLFQKNILKKYADAAPQETVTQAWQQFKQYFLNPDIQENIRQSKEEQFQEGFLRELFVKVLGYTLNPSPDYNLITEQKNETNSKKADGAILVDGKVVGVIELKDHKTTDLSKIEQQAFGYKNQNQNAVYVVISNFEKLRFYIDNAVECVEFDLFHLTENEFSTLWLCLAWPNIAANLPKRIKAESVSSEDAITNALYRDYTAFKQILYQDILKNNCGDAGRDAANCTDAMNRVPTAVELYKKTQKLLDRLLFIFFAEDGGLLPPNTMVKIIADWEKLAELDEYQPLYNRIKKYFGYLDTGYRGKDYEIFAYNGGLFKPDEVLDNLVISDDVLAAHTRRLSEYDYRSEVDVNILGHIFENSLNEIENVENQSITESAPATTTKRKRDGVFYTPQYITKYIVENTVGRLCTDKKAELQINEQEYFADKQRKSNTKKALLEKLDAYRQWLLQITICDPACGSGAFLNAALNFLIAEHRLVDEMEAKVLEQPMVIPNIENSILENNLFGVDINEESVEIAKLSLWLRTARPHRKLNSLNKNIKCGNSLISDPKVAGSKAFDWQAEFPQVFERGGFDVVIGNPPYVSAPMQVASPEMAAQRQAIIDSGKFNTLHQKWDLYIPFIELGIKHLCKDGGFCAMIVPYPLTNQLYAMKCRQMLLNEYNLIGVVDCTGTKVFADAVVQSCIFVDRKTKPQGSVAISKIDNDEICFAFSKENQEFIQDEKNFIWNTTEHKREANRHSDMHVLGDFCYISVGMVLNADEKIAQGEFTKDDLIRDLPDEIHTKKYIEGKDLERYLIKRVRYLEYGTERCPAKIRRQTFPELYVNKKLVINGLGNFKVALDCNGEFYSNHKGQLCLLWKDLRGIENNSISSSIKKFGSMSREEMEQLSESIDLKYILSIINSKYANILLSYLRGDDINIYPEHIRNIPIPTITPEQQQPFIALADKMLTLNSDLQQKVSRFLRRIRETYNLEKTTAALETFYTLSFSDFVKELGKQKVKLTLVQKDELEDYFNAYQAECQALKTAIATTDRAIDQMVYALYGLTDEEIAVVEK